MTAPAAGSTLYYSLLYSNDPAQQRVIDTLKLVNTLSTTLYDVNEPQVAEKKIHWWHEELSRLATQDARHPDCIAVQDYQHSQLSIKACLNILSASASERYNPLATEHDLSEHIITDYRARITLFEHAQTTEVQSSNLQSDVSKDVASGGEQPITFQPSPSTKKTAEHNQKLNARDAMALGLGYSHRLNSLAPRIHSGYPVFSDETYQRYNVTPENIVGGNDAQTLLEHAIAQAKDALSDAIELCNNQSTAAHLTDDHLPIAQRSNQNKGGASISLPLYIMCHIRQAQMQLWQKKQPNLIRESVALTPIRKFFIAYRCKRRHASTG